MKFLKLFKEHPTRQEIIHKLKSWFYDYGNSRSKKYNTWILNNRREFSKCPDMKLFRFIQIDESQYADFMQNKLSSIIIKEESTSSWCKNYSILLEYIKISFQNTVGNRDYKVLNELYGGQINSYGIIFNQNILGEDIIVDIGNEINDNLINEVVVKAKNRKIKKTEIIDLVLITRDYNSGCIVKMIKLK